MRKLFTLMACAALTAGSAFADIKIGETTYTYLQDAVSKVEEGQTIELSGEVQCTDRAGKAGVNFSITGD